MDIQKVDKQACADHIGMPWPPGKLILGIGPCRSGTTPLLRLFDANGVQAHFQPIKNIVRHLMLGRKAPNWRIPPGTAFVKETLGPYYMEEVKYDPLKILDLAGYPMENIELIIMLRDPKATWASWKWWWKEKVNVYTFLDAWEWTRRYASVAQRCGVKVHYFVYEMLRDYEPALVANRLFNKLEIGPGPLVATVNWWHTKGLIWPDEPPEFVGGLAHKDVKASSRLVYRFDYKKLGVVTSPEAAKIHAREGANYEEAYEACRAWLKL